MTSILEALRELEEERKRTEHPAAISVTDAPPSRTPSTGLLYPSIAGLAVGALLVGLVAWWAGFGSSIATDATLIAPVPNDSPGPTVAARPTEPTPPVSEHLGWLDRAAPPQARVTTNVAPAPAPTPPRASTTGTATPSGPSPDRGARAGSVTVESIRYAAVPEQRSVTLRLDGRRITLHQGGRAAGIEVQLILEDGAYLNRGSEVFFAVPGR